MKLKSKLLVSLIILIIFPLITGIGITYYNIRNSINIIDEQKAYDNLQSVSNYMNFIVDNHKNSYSSWTPWDDFYNAIAQKDTDWIKNNIFSVIKEDTNNEAVAVINADGTMLSEENVPSEWKNINFKDFNLFKSLTKDTPCVSGLEMTSDGLYIVSITKVVKEDDTNFSNFDGFTLYARKIKNSTTVDGHIKKGLIDLCKDITGVDITLKLDNGTVLSTGKNNMAVNLKSSDFKNNEIKLVKKNLGNSIDIQTEKVLTDVEGKPIGIISVETKSTAGVTALSELAKDSAVLILILLLSVIIVSLVIINIGLKPLKIMIDEFNEIASGDLTASKKTVLLVNYLKKKDEIGDFARAFDRMKSNLRSMLLSVNKSVDIVAATSNTLTDISQNTSEAANETSSTIAEMAHGAAKLSDYAYSILNMMENTQTYINNGTNELSIAAGSIDKARNVASNSNKSMMEAVDYAATMSAGLNESSESIIKLKGHSSEIGSIVSTIRGITEQTNLLALNAAIEAARAGEYGRGFAVVADEIRKLSEESSIETKHIEKLVENIQFETDSAVKNIENNLNAFSKQVEFIKGGEAGLLNVVKNIDNTEKNSKKLEDIFNAIKENIDNTFVNIKKITESIADSAKDSEQLAAVSEEQLATFNQVTQSSQDLLKLAEVLESEMNKFKV